VPFRGFLPEPGAPEVKPLPALSNGFLTFGSFNRLSKISEATIDLWSRVLHAIPDAKMLVGAAGEPRAEERLRKQFESRGIAPARLSFRPRMQMAEYLALHHEVDVVLDTFPYTGGTTTSQALWMGVPVLTLEGSTSQQRQSATILAMLGLDEWSTRTPEAYIEQARAAAADLPALDRLRQSLRAKMAASVHGSQEAVRREMDTALQTMWRRWCAGLPPESFAVSD
jgi:predicted O-linked N-acetylglucosamine transferase (SPINDLY family)